LTCLPVLAHLPAVRPPRFASLASLALAAGLVSCAPTACFDPVAGHVAAASASPWFDAMGVHEFERYKQAHKISTDPALKARVERVVKRLTPHTDLPNTRWEVVVFDDPSPNAFALPGGKIGVHSGVFPLTANDAGLAAALGHEIAHLTLHHAQTRVNHAATFLLGGLILDAILVAQGAPLVTWIAAAGAYGIGTTVGVLLPQSRAAELQADQLGTLYMTRAGYDPREAPRLWRRFARHRTTNEPFHLPEFLLTHPLDATRIRALDQFIPVALREYRDCQAP